MRVITDKGVEELANAIVIDAAVRWRQATLHLSTPSPVTRRYKEIITECETFFKSDWFEVLTGLNGIEFLHKLKEGYSYQYGKK